MKATKTILSAIIILASTFTVARAQGLYTSDFIALAKCADFTCVDRIMQRVNYKFSTENNSIGTTKIYKNNVANDDGSVDIVSFTVKVDKEGQQYNEAIFGTDRFNTHDAMYQILRTEGFSEDKSLATTREIKGLTATVKYFFSPLHKGMTMIVQTFTSNPDGGTQQYYISLQY